MRKMNAEVPLLSLGNTQLSYTVRTLNYSEELSIQLHTQTALVNTRGLYIYLAVVRREYCFKHYTERDASLAQWAKPLDS